MRSGAGKDLDPTVFGQPEGKAEDNPFFNCNYHLLGPSRSKPANKLHYWDIVGLYSDACERQPFSDETRRDETDVEVLCENFPPEAGR
jgi:hypothetical protein